MPPSAENISLYEGDLKKDSVTSTVSSNVRSIIEFSKLGPLAVTAPCTFKKKRMTKIRI